MKTLSTIFITLFICLSSTAQYSHDPNVWNSSVRKDAVDVYNPEEEELTATVTIEYAGKEYSRKVKIEGQDWVEVTYNSLGLTYENMPTGTGVIEVVLRVEAGGQGVLGDYYFISLRNPRQPYEVSVEELGDKVNLYGTHVDDCIFWIDFKGYNYVIRSHNEGRPGIFMTHWILNVLGETEQINYYKNHLACMAGKVQNQYHSVGWKLEDANEDGYMEFYSMIFDACEESRNHPQDAMLKVFTNVSNLGLSGESYSLLGDTDNIGGRYKISEQLQRYPKIKAAAEAVWEVYILE